MKYYVYVYEPYENETLSKTQAYQRAGQGGLVKDTFIYGEQQ